ncbi:MAG: hypothetical protein J6V31_02550 [Tidjanibacter sp.]|nr:hypothetical protein [Tidjanibacter sp.]
MCKNLMEIDAVKKRIKFYPDWPSEGINFIDIMPLLADAEAFRAVVDAIDECVTAPNVAAPEARGFLFASPLMMTDGGVECVIPFRKKGKLPHSGDDLVGVSIVKEYGEDNLFFRKSDLSEARVTDGVIEVTLFDDILATGGTAVGMAERLSALTVERDGVAYPVKVKEFVFMGEIEVLEGRARLESIAPVKSLIKF